MMSDGISRAQSEKSGTKVKPEFGPRKQEWYLAADLSPDIQKSHFSLDQSLEGHIHLP